MYVSNFCLKYQCDALKSKTWKIAVDKCLCYSPVKLNDVIENADPKHEFQRYLKIFRKYTYQNRSINSHNNIVSSTLIAFQMLPRLALTWWPRRESWENFCVMCKNIRRFRFLQCGISRFKDVNRFFDFHKQKDFLFLVGTMSTMHGFVMLFNPTQLP